MELPRSARVPRQTGGAAGLTMRRLLRAALYHRVSTRKQNPRLARAEAAPGRRVRAACASSSMCWRPYGSA